jgi:hypothetical protein
MAIPSDLDELLGRLAGMIADQVAEKLGRTGNSVWSSVHLPPDCPSRKRFNELARQIPDATKTGRVWFVSDTSWKLFRANARRAKPKQNQPVCDDMETIVQRSIAKSLRRIA